MDSREATNVLTALVRLGAASPVGDGAARAYQFREPAIPSSSPTTDASAENRVEHAYGDRRDNAQQLYQLLSEQGSTTAADLAEVSGMTIRQVRYALALLLKENRISVAGKDGRSRVFSTRT